MFNLRKGALAASLTVTAVSTARLATAQAAPSGPHPRLWLDAATIAGLEAQATVANSPVARGAARCSAARANPASYSMGGWQGFEFVLTLSGCLASWEASHNPDDLATAIKYWNVLLDDYAEVGDGLGGDSVVAHDSGYAMRTFAPYSAIAYDWLHDANGVTEALRAHARARFKAWVSWYDTAGYLRHMPGANYQAGYLFASTLIAIAEAGEAGATGDAHWSNVRDVLWKTDMTPALSPGGVLDGGDWPEGWQYGPLSVTEYALAGRAMGDNGAPVAGIGPWTDSLFLRYAHGLTPVTQKAFAAGDTSGTTNHLQPANGPLVAAMAGAASSQTQAWARQLNADVGANNENALFDAIAVGRSSAAEALPQSAPTSYLSRGVGNYYMRGAWSDETAWSVFQCSRRLVDDHQHNDAGNWVLTRGADDVVIDPSPYSSLSTLTGNAPAVDSNVLPTGYSPSQAGWGQSTDLAWTRQSASGVAVARCDYADQFRLKDDLPSDVTHALRDFVFVPDGADGTIVLIDRVVTGDASRGLHLRVRTPTTLSMGSDAATGVIGDSSVSIRKVWSTSGAPTVREMPKGTLCTTTNRGQCDLSRVASGHEYRIDVAGPEAGAIHVVEARPSGASGASSVLLSGSGYRGVLVGGSSARVAVVTNDTLDGSREQSLVYSVPAASETLHVVVDAPADASGLSDVTAVKDGTDCRVTVTPHSGGSDGFASNPLVVRATPTCAVIEDVAPPTGGGGSSAAGGTAGAAGSAGGTPTSDSGGMPSSGAGGMPSSAAGGTPSSAAGGTPSSDSGGTATSAAGGTAAGADAAAPEGGAPAMGGGGAAGCGLDGGPASSGADGSADDAGAPAPSCALARRGVSTRTSPIALAMVGLALLARSRRQSVRSARWGRSARRRSS